MSGPGLMEWLVIGALLLIFVGPERLPTVMRQLGRLYGKFRRAADELRRALVLEADRMDEEERLKELRKRRQEAEEQRQRMAEQTGSVAQPAPAPKVEPVAEDPDWRPDGLSEQEWAEMAPHIRDLIRRRRRRRSGR
jgi:sec-independent protein translocase protein TatB